MRIGDEDSRQNEIARATDNVSRAVAEDLDDVSDGQLLYQVMAAAYASATDEQRTEIALAFMNGAAFAELSEGTRELFEMGGEAMFEDDDEEG